MYDETVVEIRTASAALRMKYSQLISERAHGVRTAIIGLVNNVEAAKAHMKKAGLPALDELIPALTDIQNYYNEVAGGMKNIEEVTQQRENQLSSIMFRLESIANAIEQ